MKRILMTGGAGFLGTNLCVRLLAEDHQVLCLDNLYTGKLRNIEPFQKHPRFTYIHHDVSEPFIYEADEIYNLACPASPPQYQRSPTFTTRTSVIGAIHALELANRCHAKVMQFSTSEVYGDPLVHPQPESYRGHVNPIGIRACYDEGKRCAETLFFDYQREFRTKIKVIRIFNTYGPHMDPDDGRVVSNFIMQALKNEDITIYGDGSQTRSFCFVDDLIEGIVRMMNSRDDLCGPVNLGNPGEFTILELARTVIELTGSNSRIVFQPLPQDDPLQRCPDIALARNELGWSPTVDLHEGLKRTIGYFKALIE